MGGLLLAVGLGAVVVRYEPDDTAPGAAPSASPTSQAVRAALLPSLAEPPAPTAAGVAAALGPLLADRALGPSVAAVVVDVASGAALLDVRGSADVIPASTTKIATAVAVLTALPPDARLRTRAVAGPEPGDVVLVGGGDVMLAGPAAPPASPQPARLTDLAGQVRAARDGAPVTRVLVDDTAYTGPPTGPGWKPGYTSDNVAPVGALSVDGGRVTPGRTTRVPDPALAAGRAFAALLGAPSVVRQAAPAGAAPLGEVHSPAVQELVELMLTRSDNDLAETLLRQVALARGRPAAFDGAAAAAAEVLAVPGVALVDGSGLSRDDRVQPAAVVALLVRAATDDTGRLGPVLSGLPVAGWTGTLGERYRDGPALLAAGTVRAKTGTLAGVSALAGLVRTADGRLLAFDVTADAVPGGARPAEAALDRVAAALAACGCR